MVVEQVLYNVAGNNNLSTVNIDDLFNIANEYPYFAPAQFLLALKQKEQNSYSFNYQLQKSALHFSNPMWLQYQLQSEIIGEPVLENVSSNDTLKPIETMVFKPIAPVVEAKPVIVKAIEVVPVIDPIVAQQPQQIIEVPPIIEDEIIPFQPSFPADEDLKNNGGVIDYSAYALSNNLKEIVANVTVPEPDKVIKTEPQPYQPSNSFTNNSNAYNVPTLEAVKLLLEGKTQGVYNPIANGNGSQIAIEKTNSPVIPSYDFNGFTKDVIETDNAVSLSEDYNEDEAVVEEEEINQKNNIAAVLSNQMANFKKPVEEDAKLEFEKEPFYTVDYFASQGIKVDLTKQPQDKLTLQLRRFTDWLKQVKGQTSNPQDLGTDPELEKAIANIAKTSLAAREIVTETMADVFIKQGKVDKAIQLYIKLSFLDPHKSAYFAEKIQQLKGI